jgi:hypothetical protein
MKRLFLVASVLVIAVMAFPTTAMAGGMLDGRVVLGGDFTLETGETLDGDLLVLGGNVTLEVDSRVTGDVNVLGGNVNSNGTVDGDVNIVGGNVRLQSNAVVRGDVRTIGGSLSRSEGAQIDGQHFSENQFDVPFDFEWSRNFNNFSFGRPSLQSRVVWYLFRTVMLAALAVLVVMFVPKPTERIAKTLVSQPIISGGVGLLTVILAPVVFIIFTITILLIPAVFLAIIVLVLAILFGWIAVGLEVGNRLAAMMKWDLHPAAAAGLGTLLYSGVVGGIGMVPCFGWMVVFLACVLALGAVLLSRGGMRTYALSPSQTALPEPDSATDEPAADESAGKKSSKK